MRSICIACSTAFSFVDILTDTSMLWRPLDMKPNLATHALHGNSELIGSFVPKRSVRYCETKTERGSQRRWRSNPFFLIGPGHLVPGPAERPGSPGFGWRRAHPYLATRRTPAARTGRRNLLNPGPGQPFEGKAELVTCRKGDFFTCRSKNPTKRPGNQANNTISVWQDRPTGGRE